MYSSYHAIGTSGHRVPSSYGFMSNPPFAPQAYPSAGGLPPPPPPYLQPHLYAPPMAPPSNQVPVTGGISAVLEYDPATMSAFMCWCVFGVLNQTRGASPELESSVTAILNATRLPRCTILVALEYTNQRFLNSSPSALSDQDMYTIIVIALVLANKFNDDNTFTNKSWASASGIAVASLNTEESTWLAAVGWRLNVVKYYREIATMEECWNTWLNKYSLMPPSQGLANIYPAGAVTHLPRFAASIPSSPSYATPSYTTPSYATPSYTTPSYTYSSPGVESPVRYDGWAAAPSAGYYHYAASSNPYVSLPQPSIWSPEHVQSSSQFSRQPFYGYGNSCYNNNCLASC